MFFIMDLMNHLHGISEHLGLGWAGVIGFFVLMAISFVLMFREILAWLVKTHNLNQRLSQLQNQISTLEKRLDNLQVAMAKPKKLNPFEKEDEDEGLSRKISSSLITKTNSKRPRFSLSKNLKSPARIDS